MAGVVMVMTMTLSLTKTFLVIDAVVAGGRVTGLLAARATQGIKTQNTHHNTSQASHVVASPRQRQGPPGAGTAPKVRSLHRRLLSMHVTSTIGQAAGVAKHMLRPISDSGCLVTHRTLVVTVFLCDASVVLFLLAKVHVTNGNRVLACWEKGIIWWSRFFAWIYLPYAAIFLALNSSVTANAERTACYDRGEEVSDDTANFAAVATTIKSLALIIQFVLLLGLFVKPMLTGHQSTQSGGAVYRRVIIRNIVCTSCIVAIYAIASVVYVITLFGESAENSKGAAIRDMTLAITQVATLCVTEIALPLGFTGCFTTCKRVFAEGSPTIQQQPSGPIKTVPQAATATTAKVVVPLEEPPRQAAP